ncbi:phosphoethanolamine transferase [Roseateles chitinivorans]|uniref:phosphoethanolamine transferase n=1 Tax=Roseateles chitinivorans TaxID=2917965 RepID=UPI003D67FCA7
MFQRPALLRWGALGLLALACAAAVLAGHESRRAAQVGLLALPALLWLLWPVERPAWRRLRWAAVFVVISAFLVDGAVRGFLQSQYQAAPDSSLVLAAAANTTPRESIEYLTSQVPAMALALAALIAMLGLAGVAITRATRDQPALSRRARIGLLVVLAVCALAHLSKPWRRHHPLLFWPAWTQQVADLRANWADQQVQREQLMRNARAATPTMATNAPSTVVLVLGESVNRDNMSLYGYARPTTPELIALRDEERARLLTLRHAWSTQATTVASLSGLFSFGERDEDDPAGRTQHLLALAKSAGYKVWWVSNHDDVAVDQQHARLADVVEMINRQPGRSSGSLDGELLDEVETALADPAPRKLVVVHLLGAHPHYRLRMPPGEHPFDHDDGDAVDTAMKRDGRAAWVREFRQDYDSAIHYHDHIVAQTLRLTRSHLPAGGRGAWMFVSDHGQEVGHSLDHAGHSPGTASGYRIPALLWRSESDFDTSTASRPFRADWAGWTLAELMQLRWPGMHDERNVLHATYAWEAPALPVKGVRFEQ